MLEDIFDVLFVLAVAGPLLALAIGVVLLVWPEKISQLFVGERHAPARR